MAAPSEGDAVRVTAMAAPSEEESKAAAIRLSAEGEVGNLGCSVVFHDVSYYVREWKLARTEGSRLPRLRRETKTILNGVRYLYAAWTLELCERGRSRCHQCDPAAGRRARAWVRERVQRAVRLH